MSLAGWLCEQGGALGEVELRGEPSDGVTEAEAGERGVFAVAELRADAASAPCVRVPFAAMLSRAAAMANDTILSLVEEAAGAGEELSDDDVLAL